MFFWSLLLEYLSKVLIDHAPFSEETKSSGWAELLKMRLEEGIASVRELKSKFGVEIGVVQ